MPVRKYLSVNPQKLQHVYPPVTRGEASKAVEMGPNLSWVQGQILGQKTADKKCYPYDNTKSDGTEVAQYIAQRTGHTDANGQVYYGIDTPTDGPLAMAEPTLDVYYGGTFKVAELIGLDAPAIADFGARLMDAGQTLLIPT